MKRPDPGPLDADLDALLQAERARPPVAAEAHDRLLARVTATIDPGGGSPAPRPPGATPPAPPVGAGSGGLLAKPILLGMALGGVVAAVVVARPDPTTVAPAAVVATVTTVTPAVPSSASTAGASSAPTPAEPRRAGAGGGPVSSPSAHEPGRDTSLGAERRLLDEAQRALAEGRASAALDAIERHERAFPRGRLAEEREGLAVRALARAGRADDARARAARFRAAHPDSILLPAIDAAVGTNP